MSKYLITGGAGFVGSNLVDYLVYKEKIPTSDIRVLVPPWESLENLYGHKLDIVIGDIRDNKIVEELTKGMDIVYHLAAKTVIPGGTFEYYKDTNVDGTRYLLEASAKEKVKKFIYFSSISVFGLPAWKGDMENYDEISTKVPSEPYGETKLEAEKLVREAYKKWKLPYVIIRPTTVYGPRDKAGIYQLMQAISKGLFFYIGSAENKMDYVYVEDLIKATRAAEQSSLKNEDFIIGSGRPNTQKEIVENVAEALKMKVPWIYIPKIVALPLSYLIKIISDLIGIKPLFFPERVRVLTANCYFDSTKARKMLNYKPSSDLQDNMRKSIPTKTFLPHDKKT